MSLPKLRHRNLYRTITYSDWIGPNWLAGRTAYRCTRCQVKARPVGAAGDNRSSHRAAGQGRAIVRADVINRKDPLTKMENSQASPANAYRSALAIWEIR